jgi:xylulokinase
LDALNDVFARLGVIPVLSVEEVERAEPLADAMIEAAGGRLERLIASGGGAKTPLWLKIKASMYGAPIVVPREPECGVVGCAALVGAVLGDHPSPEVAADAMVRYGEEVLPDPAWQERCAAMAPIFDRLYRHSQSFYDELDGLLE